MSSEAKSSRPRRQKERRNAVVHEDEYDPFPGVAEEGPHVRIRDVFSHVLPEHNDSGYDHGESVDVTHYIHDKSVRHRMVLLSLSNSKLGIRLQLLRAVFLVLGCALYVAETVYYDYFTESGAGLFLNDSDIVNANSTAEIVALQAKALVIFEEDKPYSLWALQVLNSCIIFFNACVILFATSSWNWQFWLRHIETSILIMVVIPLLYLVTVVYPPLLRNLFVPAFLYCWPTGQAITTAIIQGLERSAIRRPSSFRLKAISLVILFICFLFSWVCILHHFFRIDQRVNMFETYYFLMVTMSTVGFGDINPHHWSGRMLVTIFILSAIVYLIPQLHKLYEAFSLQQKLHNTVGFKEAAKKHILICAQSLRPLVLRDFLTEFYSDPTHYEVHCVLLVEKELSFVSQMHLRHPIWARRITVVIGSALRMADLERARAQSALACFIHTPRDHSNPQQADQHTIMCAWAVKDFAPRVKLHVQMLKPDNRLHLEIADHVVCEGELKNALLASNTHCPGIGTLVTLLLHTFKPEQRNLSSEEYQLYSQCAPCEIYDCKLGDSKYFHHFNGKNFLYTAVVAFRKYHVTLLGVRSSKLDVILLNPGLNYVMDDDDICYYIGFTREEYSKVGGASSINNALKQTCAKLAIYSLATVGIDPYQLDEKTVHSEVTRRASVVSSECAVDGPSTPPLKHNVSFFIPGPASSEASLENVHIDIPEQTHIHALEARRGLHLLKYHSSLDMHANPIVKVNLVNTSHSEGTAMDRQASNENAGIESHDHHPPQPPPVESFDFKSHGHSHMTFKGEPLPVIKEQEFDPQSFRRSFSEGTFTEQSPKDNVLYSSNLSLVNSTTEGFELSPPPLHHPRLVLPRPSLWSTLTHTSRSSITSLDQHEEILELDLADIQEEEELEELEDGHCDDPARTSEERSPSPVANSNQDEKPHRVRYRKGPLPSSPYFGFESLKCHLLPQQRCHDDVLLKSVNPDWEVGVVILYSDLMTEDLYHFVLPLRASYLPSGSLHPVVVMVKQQPSEEFLSTLAWLPLVCCITGDLEEVNDWLLAGVTVAETVVILRSPVTSHTSNDEEHMTDAVHIMAVQKLSKLFPTVNIVTELHYRYNIRFMRFTACDKHFFGNINALTRRGDHLTYLFVPQFAGGRVFCASMLDTLLYQAHVKPYITDLVRQLVGCKQVPGSGFLWHVHLSHDLLQLQTYERVFQRLVSQHRYIPLGILRSVPARTCPELFIDTGSSECTSNFMDKEGITSFLQAKMDNLGLDGTTGDEEQSEDYQSFVLPNPPPKTQLKPNDIILVIHSPSHPHTPPHETHTPPSHPHTPPHSTYSSPSHPRTPTQGTHSTPSDPHTPLDKAHPTPSLPHTDVAHSTPSHRSCFRERVESETWSNHLSVPIECYDHGSETQV